MERYVVFHDYGLEGWKIVGQYASMLEAAQARDDDMRNGGGESQIFEWVHPFEAYDRANSERRMAQRNA